MAATRGEPFAGVTVAIVTPFKGGEIDWDDLGKLVDWHCEQGTDGLVPCGTEGHRRDRHVEADDRRDGKHDDAMGHGGGGRHGLILAMIAISAIVDRLGPLLRRPTAWRRARPPLPPRRFRHQRDTTTRAQQKDTA